MSQTDPSRRPIGPLLPPRKGPKLALQLLEEMEASLRVAIARANADRVSAVTLPREEAEKRLAEITDYLDTTVPARYAKAHPSPAPVAPQRPAR